MGPYRCIHNTHSIATKRMPGTGHKAWRIYLFMLGTGAGVALPPQLQTLSQSYSCQALLHIHAILKPQLPPILAVLDNHRGPHHSQSLPVEQGVLREEGQGFQGRGGPPGQPKG